MNTSLRSIPAVGTLLNNEAVQALVKAHGADIVTYCARCAVDEMRAAAGDGTPVPSEQEIALIINRKVHALARPSLVPVINATGIIIHTNLGRAPLGTAIADELARIAQGYCNLEFDCGKARRGHRADHLTGLLSYLTGAESSVVVNNNAAGVMLVLHTLANRKEVIISRGELIEIGGAFRIPDIMRASGAKMIEVGTTNRTRLSDYAQAFSPKTALIFKAHTSNYAIRGFTEDVSVKELAAFAREKGVPCVYDIGSGLLKKPSLLKDITEPDVHGALADGADLVAFSCDKLMGGPQGGIVAGRRDLVTRLVKAPLMRAVRAGKLTYAALGAACRSYLDDNRLISENPVFAMLSQTIQTIQDKAVLLSQTLRDSGIENTIESSTAQCGGGTLPDTTLESRAVKLALDKKPAEKLYRKLMIIDTPVIGVLKEGALFFDVFAMSAAETASLAESVAEELRCR